METNYKTRNKQEDSNVAEKPYEERIGYQTQDLRDDHVEDKETLKSKIEKEEPEILDEFEGKVFMRGTCGSKPCKGKYQ